MPLCKKIKLLLPILSSTSNEKAPLLSRFTSLPFKVTASAGSEVPVNVIFCSVVLVFADFGDVITSPITSSISLTISCGSLSAKVSTVSENALRSPSESLAFPKNFIVISAVAIAKITANTTEITVINYTEKVA